MKILIFCKSTDKANIRQSLTVEVPNIALAAMMCGGGVDGVGVDRYLSVTDHLYPPPPLYPENS